MVKKMIRRAIADYRFKGKVEKKKGKKKKTDMLIKDEEHFFEHRERDLNHFLRKNSILAQKRQY